MLVLTRYVGEKIIIGKGLVEIKILEISNNSQQKMSVRIGINAPKELSVHREEIYDRILKKDKEGNK